MGYDCSTAIADLVDNSIAAQASEIYVDIVPRSGSIPATIVIADNGKGMGRDELQEAMIFGANQEYGSDDLGKYGLGLKTASLSQCRILTVSSKAKPDRDTRPRRVCMRWDLDQVYKTDDWDLLAPSDNELKQWENEFLNHKVAEKSGTIVLWTGLNEALPLLSSADLRAHEKFLAQLIDEVSNHLRMVFHRFMQGSVTGRRKLSIFVCGVQLVPWDPFCRNEKTQELDIVRLPIICQDAEGLKVKETITISPFILPREDEFSSTVAWKDASGPRKWNQQQGFYFYRNNRLLQSGGWSYLRSVDEHTKLLRIAVDFNRELDRSFSINITKMRAGIPAEVREQFTSHLCSWTKSADLRYRGSPLRKSSGPVFKLKKILNVAGEKAVDAVENNLTVRVGSIIFSQALSLGTLKVSEDRKNNCIIISVPRNHEFSQIFNLKDTKEGELRKVCLAMLGLLEVVHDKKIKPKKIPLEYFKKFYRQSL